MGTGWVDAVIQQGPCSVGEVTHRGSLPWDVLAQQAGIHHFHFQRVGRWRRERESCTCLLHWSFSWKWWRFTACQVDLSADGVKRLLAGEQAWIWDQKGGCCNGPGRTRWQMEDSIATVTQVGELCTEKPGLADGMMVLGWQKEELVNSPSILELDRRWWQPLGRKYRLESWQIMLNLRATWDTPGPGVLRSLDWQQELGSH